MIDQQANPFGLFLPNGQQRVAVQNLSVQYPDGSTMEYTLPNPTSNVEQQLDLIAKMLINLMGVSIKQLMLQQQAMSQAMDEMRRQQLALVEQVNRQNAATEPIDLDMRRPGTVLSTGRRVTEQMPKAQPSRRVRKRSGGTA